MTFRITKPGLYINAVGETIELSPNESKQHRFNFPWVCNDFAYTDTGKVMTNEDCVGTDVDIVAKAKRKKK